MAHGGREKVPTLRISFEELQKRRRLLDTVRYPKETSGLGNHKITEEVENPEPFLNRRGLLHLTPTTTNSEKKKTGRRIRERSPTVNRPERCDFGTSPEGSSHFSGLIERGDLDSDQISKSASHRQSRGREAIKNGGSRQRARSEGQKSRGERSEDEALMVDWSRYDNRKIERALSNWSGNIEILDPIFVTCQGMQTCSVKILAQNLELFSKLDISSKLWKTGHYQIIEALRRCDKKKKDGVLEQFLVDSITFYSGLPSLLESKLGFRLTELSKNQVSFTSKTHLRMVTMAAMICHFWYICLGDLSRYQQQLLGSDADWSKPRRHYLWAQRLAPKDGKPYNQLAVLSINTHRRLDAVYYYMRALTAKPSFQSAYDNLVGIFADTNRKARRLEEDERMSKEREAARKRRKEQKLDRKSHPHHHHPRHPSSDGKGVGRNPKIQEFTSRRKEVWIMPSDSAAPEGETEVKTLETPTPSYEDGVTRLGGDPGEDSLESAAFTQITWQQAVKKMTSAFLVMQGKLFTRTNVESLEGSANKTFHCLRRLLKGELRLECSVLFLKMMVISLYSIHNAAETYCDSQGTKVYYCGLGLSLTIQLVTVLLKSSGGKMEELTITSDFEAVCKQTEKLEIKDVSGDNLSNVVDGSCVVKILDFLSVLLPPVRILFDWFLCQKELYVQFLHKVKHSLINDFWTATVVFLNSSSKILSSHDLQQQSISPDSPKLWEDRMLSGFMPLKATLGTRDTFSLPDFKGLTRKEHREQTLTRMELIGELCRLLCNHDNTTNSPIRRMAPITYNKQSSQFSTDFSVVDDESHSSGGDQEGVVSGDSEGVVSGDQEGVVSGDPEGVVSGDPEGVVSGDQEGVVSGDPEGVVSGEEDSDELIELEDNSLSLGFSDSEDSVIEELSDDDDVDNMGMMRGLEVKEEAVRGEVRLDEGSSENPPEDKDSEIEHLKAQRERLARVIEERSVVMAVTKTVLSEASSKACEEVVITPKYLVPDTNCFVDMLPSIQELVCGADFVLAVPLTVIVELEGLSKGPGKSASKVATGAKNALDYIRSSFEAKIPHFRALTTQGSLLSSLAFRAEVKGKGSNDDHILESCLQLHLKTQTTSMNKSLYKVVLLTDDRNLRVKAHASSQPVKDIPGFMKLLQK